MRALVLAILLSIACAGRSPDHAPPAAGGGSSGGASAGTAALGGFSGAGAVGGSGSGGANATGGTNTGGTSGASASGGGGAMAGDGGIGASAGTGAVAGNSGSGGAVSDGGASGGGMGGNPVGGGAAAVPWVGTWTAAPQLTETANLPPAPGLSNNTLRQILYVSIGGSRVRVHLSNAYGNGSLTMTSVHLARSTSGHSVDSATDRALSFAGSPSVSVPAGGTVSSDPVDFMLPAQSKVALSIAFGNTPSDVTGHPGSRTTSYIATGNVAGAVSLSSPVTTLHWYYATGIDVLAGAASGAVVTFGDSITDGRGSTTDGNDRWPDALSRRLRASGATSEIAVLNQGIGGNAVVTGGLGPTGLTRFERDVLNQAGVRWVIVLHGVNDIGESTSGDVAQSLIDAYRQLVAAARARGVRAYGVPILPIEGSQYESAAHEAARQTVNTWIRGAGNFDAVIDLDAAVRDPSRTTHLLPAYDSGDGLHLNPAGYQRMADAFALTLFAP